MAIKKYLIHCMLAICVGLLPALNSNAMSVEHSDSMPMDCLDCDPVEMNLDSPCKNQDCNSITQSCGSHTSANYLPPSPLVEHVPDSRNLTIVALEKCPLILFRWVVLKEIGYSMQLDRRCCSNCCPDNW